MPILRRQLDGQAVPPLEDSPHLSTLQAVFQFTPAQMQDVRALPSPGFWCQFMEECFKPLLADEFAGVWTTLGTPRPTVAAQCWDLFTAVFREVAELDDKKESIDELADRVSKRLGGNGLQPIPSATAVVIFCMVCWSSMVHQPALSWQNTMPASCLAITQSMAESRSLRLELAARPLSVVFRNFHKLLPRRRASGKSSKGAGATVFVSAINYHSLRIIGRVRIQWVNDMSAHLVFDSRTRTLSLFRFPSFCACAVIASDRGALFEEYTFLPTADQAPCAILIVWQDC